MHTFPWAGRSLACPESDQPPSFHGKAGRNRLAAFKKREFPYLCLFCIDEVIPDSADNIILVNEYDILVEMQKGIARGAREGLHDCVMQWRWIGGGEPPLRSVVTEHRLKSHLQSVSSEVVSSRWLHSVH